MIRALVIISIVASVNIQALIDSHRWNEAEAQLESLSPKVRPRFVGLIAQGRGQPAKAAKAFERALAATPAVPQLHLYASHAYLKLQRFKKALAHAQSAAALRDKAIAQPLLEARAFQGLKQDAKAYAVLARACVTYAKEFRKRARAPHKPLHLA